jgi:hypothetical protein
MEDHQWRSAAQFLNFIARPFWKRVALLSGMPNEVQMRRRKLKAELRQAENSVTRHPQSWTPYLHGTRCFKFERFPFALVYIDRDDRIIGIAVAHLKRRPGYWRNRLAN